MIRKPDKSGFWMVEYCKVAKWSSYQMIFTIQKPDIVVQVLNGCSKTGLDMHKKLKPDHSILFSKTRPFEMTGLILTIQKPDITSFWILSVKTYPNIGHVS